MTADGTIWRNRIVKTGEVNVDEALANESNWRVHPRTQQAAFGNLAGKVGLVRSVLINLRNDPEWGDKRGIETFIDGHMRLMKALNDGQPTLPAEWVDLSPDEEKQVLIELDPIGAMAVADTDMVNTLMRDLGGSVDDSIRAIIASMPRASDLIASGGLGQPTPPDDFKEFGADIEVEHVCPKCGYRFSAGQTVPAGQPDAADDE